MPMNIPIEGLSISETPAVIHVRSVSPMYLLSSAIVGSGFRRVSHILNAHVYKDYASTNPKADLRALANRCGTDGPFVGLLTAVHLRKARTAFFEADGLSVGDLMSKRRPEAASEAAIFDVLIADLTPDERAFVMSVVRNCCDYFGTHTK